MRLGPFFRQCPFSACPFGNEKKKYDMVLIDFVAIESLAKHEKIAITLYLG